MCVQPAVVILLCMYCVFCVRLTHLIKIAAAAKEARLNKKFVTLAERL